MRHTLTILALVLIAATRGIMSSVAAESAGDKLVSVAGSTKRVCQLTGDLDRTSGQPTLSQTGKRFGLFGTDLGSSFEHDGRLFFLFGDTWGRPGLRDAVAWTRSSTPKSIRLNFYRDKSVLKKS